MQNKVPARFSYQGESRIFKDVSGRILLKVKPANITAQALMLEWFAEMSDEDHQSLVGPEQLTVTFQVFGAFARDSYWQIYCTRNDNSLLEILQIPQSLVEAILSDLSESGKLTEAGFISRCIENVGRQTETSE